MRALPLTLAPGQDLKLSLDTLAREQNCSGFVLGVVGNLSRAVFQCPGRPEPTVLEGDLEIITLNGTVSPQGAHLHLSLSDGACQVWGGHLEPGTLVLKGAELLLGVLDQPGLAVGSHSVAAPMPAPSPRVSSLHALPSRVEIAVLPGCPWCTRALRLLSSADVPHEVFRVDHDDAFHHWHGRSGMSTFPQVFVDGTLLGGYDALSALNQRGDLMQLR
jgi:predicted DNA-binding protein with PD1-like motif/glutaredoxin